MKTGRNHRLRLLRSTSRPQQNMYVRNCKKQLSARRVPDRTIKAICGKENVHQPQLVWWMQKIGRQDPLVPRARRIPSDCVSDDTSYMVNKTHIAGFFSAFPEAIDKLSTVTLEGEHHWLYSST
uniref:Uncharacterized protein n=1 Tax=Arundo donax TaxID=35708 RepID=A0A0A9CYB1_ARUDO